MIHNRTGSVHSDADGISILGLFYTKIESHDVHMPYI